MNWYMICWEINILSIIDTDCKIHGVDCIIRLRTHHVDLSKLRSMQSSGSCPDISRSIIHIQHRTDKNHNTLTVYTVGTSIPQQKVLTQIPQPKLLTNIPQNNRPQYDCKIIVESLFIAHFVFLACHNPSLTKWVPHHCRITLVNLNSFHIKTIYIQVS